METAVAQETGELDPSGHMPLVFDPEKRLALLSSIVNSLLDAVVVISPARRVEFANATATRVLKLAPDLILEKTLFDIFPEKGEGNGELYASVEQVFSSNGGSFGSGGRATIEAGDGTKTTVVLILNPVRGDELLGVSLSFRPMAQPAAAASTRTAAQAGAAPDSKNTAPRQKVMKALENRLAASERSFAVALALSQFDVFRLRYGQTNAEKLVRVFSNHVQESLGPGDRLYEWSNRTLILLLARDSTIDEVRLEMTALCSRRLDYFLDAVERSALVTISATWALIPLEDATPEKVADGIDSFDRAHARKR